MAKILKFNHFTKGKLSPDKVLSSAVGQLEDVLIIGTMADGAGYYASSTADGGDLLWRIEQFKRKLLQGDFNV